MDRPTHIKLTYTLQWCSAIAVCVGAFLTHYYPRYGLGWWMHVAITWTNIGLFYWQGVIRGVLRGHGRFIAPKGWQNNDAEEFLPHRR